MKFRIRHATTNELIYAPSRQFLIGLDGRVFDGNGCRYDEYHKVERFTGLCDKDSSEIYENDIVMYKNNLFQVIWNERECSFELHYYNLSYQPSRLFKLTDTKTLKLYRKI